MLTETCNNTDWIYICYTDEEDKVARDFLKLNYSDVMNYLLNSKIPGAKKLIDWLGSLLAQAQPNYASDLFEDFYKPNNPGGYVGLLKP